MVNDTRLTSIRCPSNKKHNKRVGDYIVKEEKCNALLFFVDANIDGAKNARKCSDCKNVVSTEVKDKVVYVSIHHPNTRIITEIGKVVVE
jgi:hypothetical protein